MTALPPGGLGRRLARLVRPAPPRPALARPAGRNRRSVPGLAERDHAPADHCASGHTLLRQIPRPISEPRGARRRARRGGDGGLGRPRLLRPRPQPARLRQGGRRRRDSRARIEGLRALPGIGAYTAAAIGAIAFGLPVVPVDGNVERVVARLFAVTEPLPAGKAAIADAAARLGADPVAAARPSDFAQALFDLGATICTPARPACALCPWREDCAGRRAGIAEELPARRRRPRGRCVSARISSSRTRSARSSSAAGRRADCSAA